MEKREELRHLRRADADIAAARSRIERQLELVGRLQEHGHDAETARSVLQTMRETLQLMEDHRELILKELGR
jgi:hypothetical protein